jgi:hypothetical protein
MNTMVRCEDFYKYYEKRGNFCGKSDTVVKKVEDYIDYVRRHKLRDFSGYKISNSALDPFISIEHINHGMVHKLALKELKRLIRKRQLLPEKITRRVSIEIINEANNKVEDGYKLDHIPNIRNRMGEFEHEIGEIGFEVREMFTAVKNDIGAKNNNEVMKIMLELCIKNSDELIKIKNDLENKTKSNKDVEITAIP